MVDDTLAELLLPGDGHPPSHLGGQERNAPEIHHRAEPDDGAGRHDRQLQPSAPARGIVEPLREFRRQLVEALEKAQVPHDQYFRHLPSVLEPNFLAFVGTLGLPDLGIGPEPRPPTGWRDFETFAHQTHDGPMTDGGLSVEIGSRPISWHRMPGLAQARSKPESKKPASASPVADGN